VRWKQIRAGLLALVVLFMLVDGCPLPGKAQENAWNRGITSVLRPMQHAALVPFRWLKHGLHIGERWTLFSEGPAERFRLVIEGQLADGTWHETYRAGDPAHQDHAQLFEYERIRGTWDPFGGHATPAYDQCSRWIAQRELGLHPEIVAARVRFERIHIADGVITEAAKPIDRFLFTYTATRGKR
jgi:hypothetical protein